MSDPFKQLRRLARDYRATDDQFRSEVQALRASGYTLRAIAAASGLSPDTVMRWCR
jgi:DNA-directed RNA polymerase specialized sigma24 family protein